MKPLKKAAIEILKILNSKSREAYLVGGCVRDELLNRNTKDFDIATNATVEEVSAIFKQKSWKVIPTGIEHGTLTVVHKNGHPYEVTTFRKDITTDGRRAEVSHAEVSVEEDASRRDFTINAMYQDQAGGLLDFFGGSNDIESRLLRFVGDASERIQEDYLRILRLFRFSSQLDFNVSESALQSTKELINGIKLISTERITKEWLLLLNGRSFVNTLGLMRQTNVLSELFPSIEWQSLKFPELEALKVSSRRDLAVMAAILMQTKTNDSSPFLDQLCLSKKDQGILNFALKLKDLDTATISTPADAMEILDQCTHYGGDDSILGFFIPLWTHCATHPQLLTKLKYLVETEEKWGYLRRQKAPINGKDLADELGLEDGPGMGRCLLELKKGYRNQVWSKKEEGLSQAKIIAKKYGIA